MYITDEMRKSVEGKKVAFTYNGKKYEREITSVMDVILGTWIGDIGFEIEDDFESDSFIIHGNTDKDNIPIMEGLVIQYDSQDETRHGYIHCEKIKHE